MPNPVQWPARQTVIARRPKAPMAAQMLLMAKAKVRARPVRPAALVAPTRLVRARANRRHPRPQNEKSIPDVEASSWAGASSAYELASTGSFLSHLIFAYSTVKLLYCEPC